MSDSRPDAQTPSPLRLAGDVFFGAVLGTTPGFFLFLGTSFSWSTAVWFSGFILIFGILSHFAGWALFILPFKVLRWLWQRMQGDTPAEPEEPEPQPRTHWISTAGFWSGFAIMTLLWLRAGLQIYEAPS